MNKERIFLLLLVIVAVLTFYVSNDVLSGYLRREISARDFANGDINALDYYEITTRPPFKYRILFSSIVKASFYATKEADDVEGYYVTYKAWSLVFFVTSVLAAFFLLRKLDFSAVYSFAGSLIFLLMPPMLLAYTTPVHTREDTLAYTILFTGLIFLVREHRVAFFVTAILGALTRETLLLLPLLYLFYGKDDNILRRLLISGAPVILWVSVRFIIGVEKYDMWEGLKWNVRNPEQVIAFLILTFNFAWLPFLLHLFNYRRGLENSAGTPKQFFYRSSVFSLFVILFTTFIGGIYNEIRLLFLFAPWILVILIDFIQSNKAELKILVAKPGYWIYATAVIVGGAGFIYLFLQNWTQFIQPGKYKISYELWLVTMVAYMALALLFFPGVLRIWKLEKSSQ